MSPSSTSPLLSQDAGILSATDVERLLRDDSPDSRSAVLEKISANYNAEHFKTREREVAEQVFRLLMKDMSLKVREVLAERLKDNINVPRDIVLHLASDVEAVARPVLIHSKVLSDADLVSIVEQSKEVGKLIAISQRETVSARVSDALIETRYSQVMTSLLTNQGAIISDRSLERIAEDFRDDAGVITALSKKSGLPLTVVERIISQTSTAVAEDLRARYRLDEEEVKKDTAYTREDFMVRLLSPEISQEEIEALVTQMAQEERLTPSIVMTSLCRGQTLFFGVALAHFSGISTTNALRLIADRGAHGFNGLYLKSGLPESMIDAVRLVLRAVQDLEGDSAIPGSALYANRLAERVVLTAGEQPIEYLPYFIALIRQTTPRAA